MSTRSLIAIENDDHSYDYIYCHWDGYPEYVGVNLYTKRNTPEKVRELINMGDRSTIDDDNSVYEDTKGQVSHQETFEKLVAAFKDSWCEYLYIYSHNMWMLWDGSACKSLLVELLDRGVSKEELGEVSEEEKEEAKYRPTAEALLFTTLQDWGVDVNWNYKVFHGIYEDFMKSLEKHGYAEYVEGDE